MDVKKTCDVDSGQSRLHPTLETSTALEPAGLRYLEKILHVEPLIDYAENVFIEDVSDISDLSSDENQDEKDESRCHQRKNGFVKNSYRNEFDLEEWEEEKLKFYNLKSVGSERKWLEEILLSDDSDGTENELNDADLQEMLKLHKWQKKIGKSFQKNPAQYQDDFSFYGSSLVLEHDKYHDRQKKRTKLDHIIKKKKKKKKCKPEGKASTAAHENSKRQKIVEAKLQKQLIQQEKDINFRRKKLWNSIVKKEIPKANRTRMNTRGTVFQTLKKVAQACQRERRKEALRSQKISKESIPRARKMAREMLLYWKRFDKVEKEHRKKAEKEAMEQRRQDEEMREMKRQQRKLNFLITQTELYAHFMGKKIKGGNQDVSVQEEILKKLDDGPSSMSQRSVQGGVLVNNSIDDYDPDSMKAQALLNAQDAVLKQENKISMFGNIEKKSSSQQSFDNTFSLANPSLQEKQHPQPKTFIGKLKTYQLKGMNWLINLYEQGINGILADEMGLGKTVQSIVFLAYLAEVHNIWGPFLIVAPASTLHNWQQEFTKFLPRFKVLPYWGDPGDRKSLRKFWNQNSSYMNDSKENAPFHVLITSYQLVVQDVKYFQRIRWQYLVLDEAHAIKSSSSIRWKILLGYNCRNRLLLTGTPIQNSMAELWALLHFIMPTLFDSHDEFNEWFSKDIENHASEKKPSLDQNQLSRLHMILKPFMLRRIKKDVENELSEKIEIKVICDMSSRQKLFYQAVKNKILFEDLLQSATSTTETKSSSLLMNLVMQFRKVCNHPELFERKEPRSGFQFCLPPLVISKTFYRDGFLPELPYDKVALFERCFQIWNQEYMHYSLSSEGGCFGFTRFINLSPADCVSLFKNIVARLLHVLLTLKTMQKLNHQTVWRAKTKNKKSTKYLSRRDLLIFQPTTYHDPEVNNGLCSDLFFARPNSSFCGHERCLISEIKSTKNEATLNRLEREPEIRECVPVYYPAFLASYYPKVESYQRQIYCSDRSAAYKYSTSRCSELTKVLRSGFQTLTSHERKCLLFPPPLQGLDAMRPQEGWMKVKIPDRSTLLSDSGKLMVLDQLLTRLKPEGHRVLIYSQMTKMINILEEFMNFRQHSYMRLDGSSKICDRRDMVADFQSKEDIFAFLLSTRAGGLGINLTAADTVIFYDSDWNPTVDQQAMDRAHRLGQTRQVTVYRLVTKGTVEEKILNRAREKSEIQNIVISGGQFNKDVLRPKEVVSLLLDDAELEAKLKQRQYEKKLAEESGKRPGRKRKQVDQNNTQDSSSPKVGKKINNGLNDDASSVVSENSMSGFEPIGLDENSFSSLDFANSIMDEDSTTESSSRPPSTTPFAQTTSNNKAGTPGRKRGRGRGSSTGRGRGKSKSGTLALAAASAAAAAGAAAGSAAAYAAYGYSFQASNKTS